jgi:iron(III) transport system substrate-binding protein
MSDPQNVPSRRLALRFLPPLLIALVSACATGAAQAESAGEIEAAANKEGRLIWYAAMRDEHADKLAELFHNKFPNIKIETIHLISSEITARLVTEQRGRRYNADIASGSSDAISQINSEHLLQPFVLPPEVATQLEPGTYDQAGYWLSQYVLTYPITYNPVKLAEEGLQVPTSIEDLAAPKWAGKFAISSDYSDWYQGLVQFMGYDAARGLLERLAANQPLIRSNSGAILQLLEAGEFAASPQIYGYNAYEDIRKGKPVGLSNVTPVVVTMQTGGILVNAPHPNAAKLYQLWMASRETQQFMSSALQRTSTHPKIENIREVWDPTTAKYVLLDPDKQVRESRKFRTEYKAIFHIGG